MSVGGPIWDGISILSCAIKSSFTVVCVQAAVGSWRTVTPISVARTERQLRAMHLSISITWETVRNAGPHTSP